MKNIRKIIAIVLVIATLALTAVAASASSIVGNKIYTTGNANIRKGPGKGYDVITTVGKGKTLTRLDSKKDSRGVLWYKVKVGGKTGWISSVFSGANPGMTGKIRTTGSANIRNKANKDAKIIKTVGAGKTLKYTDTKTDKRGVKWYLVTIGNTAGWISSKNVKRV